MVGVIAFMLELCQDVLYLLYLFEIFLFKALLFYLWALIFCRWAWKLFLLRYILIRNLTIDTIFMLLFAILLVSSPNEYQFRSINNKIGSI